MPSTPKRESFSDRKVGSKDPNRHRRVNEPVIPDQVVCAAVMPSNDSVSSTMQYDDGDYSVAPRDNDFCLSVVDEDEDYLYIPPANETVGMPPITYTPKTEAECRDRRLAVKFFYQRVCGAPPPKEWRKLGLVQTIARHVATGKGGEKSIRAVMEDIYCAIMTGDEYDGKRRSPAESSRKAIADDSDEMQFIVDHIEQGLGLRFTTHLLNCNRLEEGKKAVGCTAVYNAMKRCKPVVTAVKTVPQGSAKKDSDWAKARLNWVIQVLIRYGKFPPELLDELKDEKGNLPDYFNKSKLTCFEPDQVAFFDETHKKQLIGNINRTDIRFYRDANGKLDLKNGTLREPRPKMKAKFHKEARMVLGVAADKNGKGCRLPLFDYTQKHVCYIREWDQLVKKEIKRVKNLKTKKGPWYESRRVEGAIYSGDPVGSLLHIGETTQKRLNDQEIVTVADLFLHPNSREILYKAGLRGEKLEDVLLLENDVERGPPVDIDHRQAVNPYKSLYGEDWEERIRECSNLSPYVCITHIIEHIVDVCTKHFAKTKYGTKWYFYHDALKQMTDKKCIAWMKTKGFLKHWILPEQKLNKEYKRYFGRPIGNSPELMPLDTCLIKDLSDAVRRHAAITHKLAANNARKFDMSTPKRLMRCYTRIWNNPGVNDADGNIVLGGVPSSERISTDMGKIFDSMIQIYNAGGAIVPNCGTRSGKRARLVPADKKSQRGGWRKPNQKLDLYWTHPDAQQALSKIMQGPAGDSKDTTDDTVDVVAAVPEIEDCERDDIQIDANDIAVDVIDID